MENLTLNELRVMSALDCKERYGLEIIKSLKEEKITIYLGSLYNVLSRLEKKDFVESHWGDDTDGRNGSRRRYYKLTGNGARVLANEKSSLSRLWGTQVTPVLT